MVKRYGNIEESVFKQYGPEEAGQKVGWSTVVPTDSENEAYYLLGAYATVGPDGGSVSILEDKTNNERLWHTGMATGLSRACSYAVLLIPGEDVRLRNADFIRVQDDNGDALSGHSFHFERDVDDERVVWATGEQNLVETLKANLEQQGLSDQYSYAYLWINGAAGAQYPQDGMHRSPDRVAEVQLFDESMTDIAAAEYRHAKEYELTLHNRFLKTKAAYNDLRRGAYSAGDYLKLREVAHRAHASMSDIVDQLTVPKVVYYAPEKHLDLGSHFLGQPEEGLVSLYSPHMRQIQAGRSEIVADELEREARHLERHFQYTERGVVALFALTTLGREYLDL